MRFKIPERKKTLKPVRNYDNNLVTYTDVNKGDFILHERFGKGEVVQTEGSGGDKKAEVSFSTCWIKKILLKFAKYQKVTS